MNLQEKRNQIFSRNFKITEEHVIFWLNVCHSILKQNFFFSLFLFSKEKKDITILTIFF